MLWWFKCGSDWDEVLMFFLNFFILDFIGDKKGFLYIKFYVLFNYVGKEEIYIYFIVLCNSVKWC